MQMPPASLEMLVTTLVTEAMMSLGQVPHPHTGEVLFQPQQAKYLIDMIDMLREKTKGNVTPDETELMEQLLHQLRLAYVQLTAAPAAAGRAIETPNAHKNAMPSWTTPWHPQPESLANVPCISQPGDSGRVITCQLSVLGMAAVET